MKCLSVREPWAMLLVLGVKRYETRGWHTSYRGPVAIHASNRFPEAARNLCYEEPFKTILRNAGYDGAALLPLGHLIGQVDLVNCLPTNEVTGLEANELCFGDFRPGRWAWQVAKAVRFPEPIRVPGR